MSTIQNSPSVGNGERANAVKFERIVKISPAFDRRHPEPSRNYGVGSATIHFVVRGPEGAIGLTIFSGWSLPHVPNSRPLAADISYHSLVPLRENQSPRPGCNWLDGRTCYGGGSALAADDYFETLVRGGDEALWPMLESYYRETFSQTDSPDPIARRNADDAAGDALVGDRFE